MLSKTISVENSSSSGPLVSVVIPAFAAAAYIRQTLDSVFAQKYPRFEVIVVNDGSPDTEQLEAAIAGYGNRVVYLKQENRGPSAARNAGILQAQGEFIAFLDSDDLWFDSYLQRQVEALQEGPGYDFVYSDALLLRDDAPSGQTFMQRSPSRGPVTFDSLLALECVVISSGTVVRRDAIVNAGLFDERFWHCEDFDLWLRIAFGGARMRYQQQVLAHHRLRTGSLSASAQAMRDGRRRVYEKVLATLPLSDSQCSVTTKMLRLWTARIELEKGKQLLLDREYAQARSRLQAANEYFRSRKIGAVIALLGIAPAPARRLYQTYLQALRSRNRKLNRNSLSSVADHADIPSPDVRSL